MLWAKAMSGNNQSRFSPTNRLLTALPPREYNHLAPFLKLVSLDLKQVLYEPNEPIKQVYFPDNTVIPIVSRMKDGRTVEAGMVGNEGVVGIYALLGASSPYQYIALTRGHAHRVKAEVLQAEFKRGGTLQDLFLRYTQARLAQFAQISACNYLHPTIKRVCRWLLMVDDRRVSDEIFLTQKDIARMLCVRRTGITEAVGILQKKKLIYYHYGRITILDREGLERAACECYSSSPMDHIQNPTCLKKPLASFGERVCKA
jgi:CRP-like cAMP-binding protein